MHMHTYQAAARLSAQRRALLVALRTLGLARSLLGLRARALKRRLLAHGRVLRDGGPQQRVVAVVLSGGRARLRLALAHLHARSLASPRPLRPGGGGVNLVP